MSATLKAVVCGSRDWPAPWFVTAKIIELVPRDWLVITGGARRRPDLPDDKCSVDEHAHMEAVRLGYATKVMPADWRPGGIYNPRAGFERNIAMLEQEPALVLAFHAHGSRGTGHTIREAYKRGIRTEVFTEENLRPDIAALDMDDEPITLTASAPHQPAVPDTRKEPS